MRALPSGSAEGEEVWAQSAQAGCERGLTALRGGGGGSLQDPFQCF